MASTRWDDALAEGNARHRQEDVSVAIGAARRSSPAWPSVVGGAPTVPGRQGTPTVCSPRDYE
jgi:hypothetical protein